MRIKLLIINKRTIKAHHTMLTNYRQTTRNTELFRNTKSTKLTQDKNRTDLQEACIQ